MKQFDIMKEGSSESSKLRFGWLVVFFFLFYGEYLSFVPIQEENAFQSARMFHRPELLISYHFKRQVLRWF